MDRRKMRPAIAVAALGLGLAGMVSSLWLSDAGAQGTGDDETYEVWITDSGFNPESCTIRRFDNVRWLNKTSSVRNVTFDRLTLPQEPNTPLSTGDLQPGATSGVYSFDFIGSNPYHETYEPDFTGTVATTDGGVPSCHQLPPTPTPSPIPSATPTPSPTPTPDHPAGCGAQPGCAVVAGVSRDE